MFDIPCADRREVGHAQMERHHPRADTVLLGDAGAGADTGARSRIDDSQRGLTGIKKAMCL